MKNIWNKCDILKNPHNSWEIVILNFWLRDEVDFFKKSLWVCFGLILFYLDSIILIPKKNGILIFPLITQNMGPDIFLPLYAKTG